MKNNNEFDNLSSESIRLLSECPVCRKKYIKNNAKIIDEVDDAHLLHVRCSRCSSSVLALIFTTGFGVTSMGMLTDLSDNDVNKIYENAGIEQDDVLEIYKYLNEEKILAF